MNERNRRGEALQGPRFSDSRTLPEQQRQVESDRVEQKPLENVLLTLQVRSSHAAGFIHMRKTSFGQLRTQLLQILAAPSAHLPPIPIHLLLFLFLPCPVPGPALALRHDATR